MMLRALLLVPLLALFGCQDFELHRTPYTELAKVWRIDHGDSWGTGFPIACEPLEGVGFSVIVMTAGHVADWDDGYDAKHQDGRVMRGGLLLRRHESLDAALLMFPSESFVSPVAVSFDRPRAGQLVFSAGAQGKQEIGSVVMWVVSGLVSSGDRVAMPMYYGGSGSPIMRSDGKVVALVSMLGVGWDRWTGAPELIMHQTLCVATADLGSLF